MTKVYKTFCLVAWITLNFVICWMLPLHNLNDLNYYYNNLNYYPKRHFYYNYSNIASVSKVSEVILEVLIVVYLILFIAFLISYSKFCKKNAQFLPKKKTHVKLYTFFVFLLNIFIPVLIGNLLLKTQNYWLRCIVQEIFISIFLFLLTFCWFKVDEYNSLVKQIGGLGRLEKYKKSAMGISITLIVLAYLLLRIDIFNRIYDYEMNVLREFYRRGVFNELILPVIGSVCNDLFFVFIISLFLIYKRVFNLSKRELALNAITGVAISNDSVIEESDEAKTNDIQIQEDTSNTAENLNKNDNGTQYDEQDLKFHKVKGKCIPKISWWAQNGYSLTQIPLEETRISDFDTPIKGISALATWSLIKTRVPIMLVKLLIALACIIYGIVSGSAEGGIFIGLGFIGGMFLFIKDAQLLRGFEALNKTDDFVYFPWWFVILKFYIIYVSLIATGIVSIILTFLNMERRSKLMMMSRIVMPNGVGYDSVIETALEYENSASWMQAMEQSLAHSQKEAYENKMNELNKLRKDLHDTTVLSFSDKENLEREINIKEKKLNEDYEKNIKPKL